MPSKNLEPRVDVVVRLDAELINAEMVIENRRLREENSGLRDALRRGGELTARMEAEEDRLRAQVVLQADVISAYHRTARGFVQNLRDLVPTPEPPDESECQECGGTIITGTEEISHELDCSVVALGPVALPTPEPPDA